MFMKRINFNKYTMELAEKMVKNADEKCRLELLMLLEKSKDWEDFYEKVYEELKKSLSASA